jgi:transcriptional regulator with GAF, ATPase, and Fis domain
MTTNPGSRPAEVPPVPDRFATTLVTITRHLVDDHGDHDGAAVLDLVLSACGDQLGTTGSGIILADPRGGTRVAAASDERSEFVELLQSRAGEGPCVECVASNQAVTVADLHEQTERWPSFSPAAMAAGYHSVHAVPMRLAGQAVGGLNLLYAGTTTLTVDQADLARLFADLAVLGLSQERDSRRARRLAERTLTTLNDRLDIDRAVGLVAATSDVDPDTARAALRRHADEQDVSLRDLARAVTDGTVAPTDVTLPTAK